MDNPQEMESLFQTPLPPSLDDSMTLHPLDPHFISSFPAPQDLPPLLLGRDDPYDGVIIDPSCLPSHVPTFVERLKSSLAHWKSQHKKGIWLQLPLQNANLVPPAAEEGFWYHHAEPDYVMMTYWIPESLSTLPPNASHQVGVGAFVINGQKEVLVVQEKTGPMRNTGVWKMPTGLVNQAEDILSGAIREVKEETGVDTEFIEIVGFRHGHHVAFGKSDLFFVCMLKPTSSQIAVQETEIAAAKWMPLEEFRSQSFYQENSMLKKMVEVAIASNEGCYRGFSAQLLQLGFQKFDSYFYFNAADLHDFPN